MTKDDSHEDPASAPAPEQAETREGSPASRSKEGSAPRSSPECSNEFLDSEEKELLCAAPDIFMIDPSLEDEFWAEFAQLHVQHVYVRSI